MKQRVTGTNSGVDSQGTIRFGNFQFDGESYLVVLGGAVVSILVFLLCGDLSMWPRGLVSILPLAAAVGWVRFFVQGRPPHFVGDFFEGVLVGRDFRLAVNKWSRRRHPLVRG